MELRRQQFLALAASALALCQHANAAPDDQAATVSAYQVCMSRAELPKFDAIRAVFPTQGEPVTETMLASSFLASPAQLSALEAYRREVFNCALAQATKLVTTPAGNASSETRGLLLDLLIRRKVTFAEYAVFARARELASQALLDLVKSHSPKQTKESEPSRSGLLACTFAEGALNGIELQVSFDESTGAVQVNRGGTVDGAAISVYEITFRQGDRTTSISRLSGAISMVAANSPPFASGHCTMVTKRAF